MKNNPKAIRRGSLPAMVCSAAAALLPISMQAQLQTLDLTSPSLTPTDLAQKLVGPNSGITISNVVFNRGTGDSALSAGTFTGGNGRVGFDQGIVLSSGDIADAVGPNSSGSTSVGLTLQGDADLQTLTTDPVTDVTILEFDFVPNDNQVFFQFVFSSEEYEEFVGSQYNDVFGFFINGENCAVVGPDAEPITINTLNHRPGDNPGLYVRNTSGERDIEPDGLTVVLTCVANVNLGVANSLKIAIGDASDSQLDSWVFIKEGSFTTIDPLFVEKTADEPTSNPLSSNGYTITLRNPGATTITATSVRDLLPEGFSYMGPTTGATTVNPTITQSGQMLEWNANFVVPAGGEVSFEFPVVVSSELGIFFNNATAFSASPVVPTGDTAPITVAECQKFIPGDVAIYDYAARTIAMDGNQAIISVIGDDFSGLQNSGSARVLVNNAGTWQQDVVLVPSPRVNRDYYGSSVDIDGDYAIVGARGDSGSKGAAYVFKKTNGVWSQQAKLVPSDGQSNDLFASEVVISGDRAYATAPYHDPITTRQWNSGGAVYVFKRTGSSWAQEAKLVADDVSGSLYLGLAGGMDVYGDRVVVGGPGERLHGFWTGSAYVFKRNGSNVWSQEAKLMASDADGGDRFGWSVAIDNGVIAVGAYTDENESTGPAPGSAYLFELVNGTWTEQQKLVPGELEAGLSNGSFGIKMDLDGDRLLVGATKHDEAYLYAKNAQNSWRLRGVFTPERQNVPSYKAFGGDVSLDGDFVMVADEHDIDVISFGGAAYFCRFK